MPSGRGARYADGSMTCPVESCPVPLQGIHYGKVRLPEVAGVAAHLVLVHGADEEAAADAARRHLRRR